MSYRFVDIFLPKRFIKWIATTLEYADIKMKPDRFVGLNLFYGIAFGGVAAIVSYILGFSLLWAVLFFVTVLRVGGLTCLAVQGGLLGSVIADREEVGPFGKGTA